MRSSNEKQKKMKDFGDFQLYLKVFCMRTAIEQDPSYNREQSRLSDFLEQKASSVI
jgi:hypothetical protein